MLSLATKIDSTKRPFKKRQLFLAYSFFVGLICREVEGGLDLDGNGDLPGDGHCPHDRAHPEQGQAGGGGEGGGRRRRRREEEGVGASH